MKLKFETFRRGLIGLCLLMIFWACYASAQTNAPATPPVKGVEAAAEKANQVVKTFMGLDASTDAAIRQEYPWLFKDIFGNALWKYLASFFYIFLAFYISKLLDYLVGVWLKKWAAKTSTQFDDLLLDLARGPVKVVSFVIFLQIGLGVFDWPEFIEHAISKCLMIVVAISLTYMVMKLVDLVMGYWKERSKNEEDRAFDDQLYPIVRKSLKVFVVVVAVLVTTSNMGIDITAAIASLSIGGLAIGLAAQDTLANLFGAVAIFLDKPFRIGDRIQLDAVDGFVETIGLRSTRVRNLDGYLVTVPNKTMGNATIVNVTRRPTIKTVMTIGVTYDTTHEGVKRAAEILEKVYKDHQMTQDVWISFNKFGAFSLDITVIHWWKDTDYKAYLGGMQEMNLEIKRRFDEEKLSFAFPTQTLYVKQDSDWKVAGAENLPGKAE